MPLDARVKKQSGERWVAQAYDQLGAELYRYALMIVADHALAEDVVQQAFVRLLGRGRAEVVCSRAFLRVVVRNEAYRLLGAVRPARSMEGVEPALLLPVEASLEAHEEQGRLTGALRQLSAQQREVVHLKVYEQLTFGQIGELLDVPQDTAASRYRYAVARLRELLVKPER